MIRKEEKTFKQFGQGTSRETGAKETAWPTERTGNGQFNLCYVFLGRVSWYVKNIDFCLVTEQSQL